MSRSGPSLALFLFFAGAVADRSAAQIIGLELVDDKTKAKFSSWLLERNGQPMIVGEALSGVEYKPDQNLLSKVATAREIVLIVADPAKPELLLYEIDGKGERSVQAKHRVVSVSERELKNKGLHLLFPRQTLAGLRSEYLKKKEEMGTRKTAVAALKLATPEWFAAHRAMLSEVDGLVGWLRNTVFPVAADKLAKDYGTELKKEGEAASKSRLETARKALKSWTVTERLTEKSAQFGRADIKWHGRETQHLRIIATGDTNPSQLDGALQLGERILEMFRTDFVDPYLAPDDRDPVPDAVFQEFFLAPEDETVGTRFLEEYYGGSLAQPREKSIKIPGHRIRGGLGTDYVEFWRHRLDMDLEGLVAHAMGHSLANMIYNRDAYGGLPDWIGEGFAYWVSFDHLSRNTVNCVAFATRSYGRSDQKEGVKPSGQGLRAAFNELALDKGPDLGKMLRIELVEMEGPDIAKAWSFLDFLITRHREKLGPFLRACCQSADQRGKTDLERLRPKAMDTFQMSGDRDVFAALDELWRRFAATDQKVDRKAGR